MYIKSIFEKMKKILHDKNDTLCIMIFNHNREDDIFLNQDF